MGIYNLKKILTHFGYLEKQSYIVNNESIFLDFSPLLYKNLYISYNESMLYRKIEYWFRNHSNNNIYIFLDSGKIVKKMNENKRRYENTKKCTELKKKKIMQLINNLPNTEEFVEKYKDRLGLLSLYNCNSCQCDNPLEFYDNSLSIINDDLINYNKDLSVWDIEKLKTYEFTIFNNTHKSNILYYQNKVLEILINKNYINKDNIFTCENVDAEFILIRKAIFFYKKYNFWPTFYSDDQDILLFLLYNQHVNESLIIYKNELYLLKKNTVSKNLALLCLIFNKSDYFNGIYNSSVTIKKLESIDKFGIKLIDKLAINESNYLANDFLKLLLSVFVLNVKTNRHVYEKIEKGNIIENIDFFFNDINNYIRLKKKFFEDKILVYNFSITSILEYVKQINKFKICNKIDYNFNELLVNISSKNENKLYIVDNIFKIYKILDNMIDNNILFREKNSKYIIYKFYNYNIIFIIINNSIYLRRNFIYNLLITSDKQKVNEFPIEIFQDNELTLK